MENDAIILFYLVIMKFEWIEKFTCMPYVNFLNLINPTTLTDLSDLTREFRKNWIVNVSKSNVNSHVCVMLKVIVELEDVDLFCAV